MLFCINTYQCRLQIVAQAYAWPGEPTPVVCERCDNCLRRFGDKPEQKDAFNEIKEMLDIVEILCSNFTKEIRPTDVADVIRCNKNASVRREGFDELPFYTDSIKSAKPKVLKNNDLATLALTDLVVRGLVNQKIVLQGHTNCKLVITDLANNARTKGGS
ncbi:hypothetical protein C2G38_518502 [Gigaspora rosea]|uniref:ATP-dependent DNA helicase RecQ zinc-binding domain-containing protein n=1 Tax=Gigaspora rosea TaxID=44941 RepID=A0A397U825_9GLOM|nr:hypothetical protein C2G38_518502 [Gigaspora rosea]